MTIDSSVLFYVLFLHVALLLSIVLGAGTEVTNKCNTTFSAVVDTGYGILLTMMTVYLNDSVSGQNETGTDRKLSSRPRMYVRCVDPKCCWWEMLWSRGSHVLLSYFPLAMPCLRLSPEVTLRRELVSPAHGWDTTNVSSLHSAQRYSVICHWMLWAPQSDECDWLVYPQQISWWTMIDQDNKSVDRLRIAAVLGVCEL